MWALKLQSSCYYHDASYVRLMHLLMTIQVASDVKEVLDTFRVAAELGSDSLGAYVISMAANVWQYDFYY